MDLSGSNYFLRLCSNIIFLLLSSKMIIIIVKVEQRSKKDKRKWDFDFMCLRCSIFYYTSNTYVCLFIHMSIAVIVKTLQHLLVPMPVLAPIIPYLPPPLSVCVCGCCSLDVPRLQQREEARASEALAGQRRSHTGPRRVPPNTNTQTHLKGLIAKPRQSRRDQDTGDDIKRPKRADQGGKNVNMERKYMEKHRRCYCFGGKKKRILKLYSENVFSYSGGDAV